MVQLDFSSICLPKLTLWSLRRLVREGNLPEAEVPDDCARLLLMTGLIESYEFELGNEPNVGYYRASGTGRCYLNFIENRKRERRSDQIRYIVTTAIALSALVKSFMPELRALWALLWK